MIIAAWKPKFKLVKGKQIALYYSKYDLDKLDIASMDVKIIWKCDNSDCKQPNKIHSINLYHINGNNTKTTNTLQHQTCQSCKNVGKNNIMYGKTHTDEVKQFLRKNVIKSQKTIKDKYGVDNISQLDEIKIKKNQIIINFENVSEYCKDNKYTLLHLEGDNKHAILTLKCEHGHVFKRKWHSFRKTKTCMKCHQKWLRGQGITDRKGFELYKLVVSRYTRLTIKLYNIPNIDKRGLEYHLDHKFSICEGFKNNVPPYMIGSISNLEIIPMVENTRKQADCSITQEQLNNQYKECNTWNFKNI